MLHHFFIIFAKFYLEKMGTILLKQVTLNGAKKDILIKGNTISKIADVLDITADKVINGARKSLFPGLVNMHTHAAMTLVRGACEDKPLQEWLQEIWKIEDHISDEMIYVGTKLAILEMIKSGTTCFLDMYWGLPQAHRAIEEMGIRGVLTCVFMDQFNPAIAEKKKKECQRLYDQSKDWCSRAKFGVSIHADYTVSEESMRWAGEFAKDHDLLLHAHISETSAEVDQTREKYGFSPVVHFDKLDLLDSKTIAAHCVWLDDNDISILGERGVSTVHNVNSNLKLSSGYKFKAEELRKAGANVCIGTDGAASSNNLDILEALKTMAITQKAWRNDPKAMPLEELISIATVNGANALGLKAGKIEEGALADLMLVDTHSSPFVPNFNFESNLIYAANSSCVDTLICDGNIVMEGRKVAGEDKILEEAEKTAWELIKYK